MVGCQQEPLHLYKVRNAATQLLSNDQTHKETVADGQNLMEDGHEDSQKLSILMTAGLNLDVLSDFQNLMSRLKDPKQTSCM